MLALPGLAPASRVAADLIGGQPVGPVLAGQRLPGESGVQLVEAILVVQTVAQVRPVHVPEQASVPQALHVVLTDARKRYRNQAEAGILPMAGERLLGFPQVGRPPAMSAEKNGATRALGECLVDP
jgi:hypothetical protein